MKVYTTAPIGTVVKFKLESSAGSLEVSFNNCFRTLGNIGMDFCRNSNYFNGVVFYV
jgi:hypothetical protein